MSEAQTQAKAAAKPKTNKDGFVPGERVTPAQLAQYRNKKRKAGK